MNAIQQIIASRGGVSFRDFMELALYHPEHGYYAAGRASPGRTGDFYTSVSVGPMFGELLGWQFREMWERLGRPLEFTIVEQGANDGAFAADVLAWAREAAPDFHRAARYGIVEPAPVLRERQRARLAGERVEWWRSVEEMPEIAGVHFSNELVDAFPVHRVRFRDGAWRELWVTPALAWEEREIGPLGDELEDVPRIEGYTTEVSLAARHWARQVGARVRRGWMLAIDYGYGGADYYSPRRTTGTLQAYRLHRKRDDPLAEPGSQDLTAHVEFASLARETAAAGMEPAGFTDQHHFLTGLVAQAYPGGIADPRKLRQLKTLLHPELMGRVFQAFCVSRGVLEGRLAGFAFAGRSSAADPEITVAPQG